MMLIAGMISCDSGTSLQEYYVQSQERSDFLSLDIPASILKIEEVELSPEQREAYESVHKLNILAYKTNPDNTVDFEAEKSKVYDILSGTDYQELMRINANGNSGVVKYIGSDDAVDEVIIFGSNDTLGFALVRVLGDDMKPANMMKLMEVVQKGNINGEGLGQLKNFFDKN